VAFKSIKVGYTGTYFEYFKIQINARFHLQYLFTIVTITFEFCAKTVTLYFLFILVFAKM
jgi:hypothetical protein